MPKPIALSPRLQDLFKETKIVCFGRYAINVPKEAQVIWGNTSFPSKISVLNGNENTVKKRVAQDIKKLKYSDEDAEIIFNNQGPIEGSWQLRYYEDKASKQLNLYLFNTYIIKGKTIFLFGGGLNPDSGQSEEHAIALENNRAKSLRLRTEDDVPSDEGYCIDQGFMTSSVYDDQEMINVGIYLPNLPDVTFSISSNKDAYADYPKEEFKKKKVEELSLLARISQAQKEQGDNYPHRTVLREGKRYVQHWYGEESLIKRPNGVHDFEWGFVGTPKDVANPSELMVNMYSKVEHNIVGAAKTASLSDDEAVALWDKLLSGLKFRVKVPGAPEGSYFIPPSKTDTTTKAH